MRYMICNRFKLNSTHDPELEKLASLLKTAKLLSTDSPTHLRLF